MKKTRICELLNIEYPILQGGMLWIADANLAAAVSEGGGLGVISPLAGAEPLADPVESLEALLARAKELTTKPFGVNVPLDVREVGLLIDLLLIQEVKVAVTAAGDPSLFTELLQSAGVRVLHVVSSVKHAVKAEASGVDAIVVEGVEAGGRNGFDEIPLFSLIPQVADAVSIPIVAAGGIADARGVAAAMALGAEGVQLGTRFIAAEECIAHQRYKDALIAAGDTDTAMTLRKLIPSRSLKTSEVTQSLLALEEAGATEDELRDFMGHAASRRCGIEGDLENGEAYCGASVGLIKEILPAAEIIRRMADGFKGVVQGLA